MLARPRGCFRVSLPSVSPSVSLAYPTDHTPCRHETHGSLKKPGAGKEAEVTEGSCQLPSLLCSLFSFLIYLKYFTYLLVDRGEGREKERERNTNVQIGCL